MIIMDLEWNRSYDKIPLEEILQIGAVRLERMGGPIVDTFSVFIRPYVHKKLNRTAKALPELQRALNSKVRFPAALQAFSDWCGEETVFADWGGDDFEVLRQNCAYWKLSAPKPVQLIDLQAAFSLLFASLRLPGVWCVRAEGGAAPRSRARSAIHGAASA